VDGPLGTNASWVCYNTCDVPRGRKATGGLLASTPAKTSDTVPAQSHSQPCEQVDIRSLMESIALPAGLEKESTMALLCSFWLDQCSFGNTSADIANDPEVVSSGAALVVSILCTVTLHDVEYDLVEGDISRFETKPSNTSVENIFELGKSESGFGTPNLQNALTMAAVIATDAQDLANQYAIAYSKVTLSIGAGSFVLSPVLAVQERTTILVAKVPKAPLFLLVVTNLVFIVMGAMLATAVARTPREAHEV